MNIDLYYSDGCSSYLRALENLKEALRLEGLAAEVTMIHVNSGRCSGQALYRLADHPHRR